MVAWQATFAYLTRGWHRFRATPLREARLRAFLGARLELEGTTLLCAVWFDRACASREDDVDFAQHLSRKPACAHSLARDRWHDASLRGLIRSGLRFTREWRRFRATPLGEACLRAFLGTRQRTRRFSARSDSIGRALRASMASISCNASRGGLLVRIPWRATGGHDASLRGLIRAGLRLTRGWRRFRATPLGEACLRAFLGARLESEDATLLCAV